MNAQHVNYTVVTPSVSPSTDEAERERANDFSTMDLSEQEQPPSQDPGTSSNAAFTSLPMSKDDAKLRAMLISEESRYETPSDYLMKTGDRRALNGHATETWRRRLCEWMFEVADHFSFDREVVSISAYIMDRIASITYTEKQKFASKRQYQLDAVASLYLALKVHGETDPDSGEERMKLRLSNFVELSRGFFSEEVIVAKETEILNALNWHINPPTCAQFLSHYLELLPDWTVDGQLQDDDEDESQDGILATRQVVWIKIFDVAKYLTELSVFMADLAFEYKPSTIAYAALLCALEYVQEDTPFPPAAHAQLLDYLSSVSSKLAPHHDDVQQLRTKLMKLAPDFFPTATIQNIVRTVSMSDVEAANHLAAASNCTNKRAISPTCVSEAQPQEPSRKRARRTLRRVNNSSSSSSRRQTRRCRS
jgi:Cyclin, N-terminal domain/Cyclin, C-terminal domain